MSAQFNPVVLSNLLVLRRQPKPALTMCDNCLFGHDGKCQEPWCRCICKEENAERNSSAAA